MMACICATTTLHCLICWEPVKKKNVADSMLHTRFYMLCVIYCMYLSYAVSSVCMDMPEVCW